MPAVPQPVQATGTPLIPQAGVPLQNNPIQLSPTQSGGAINNVGGAPTASPGDNPTATFITQARAQGVPDDQIYNALHQQGMIPTNAVVQQGQQPEGAQLHDTGSFGTNLLNSTGNFFKGLGSAAVNVFNPNPEQNTITKVEDVVKGIAQTPFDLLTGRQMDNPTYQALLESLGQRYGSLDNIKKTAYQDPVGFLADASSLLSGAGEAVNAAGDVSKISTLSKVGGAITKAGELTNPINAAIKPVEIASNLAKAGLENLGPKLELSNLRLTPVQKANYATKLNDVTDYISKHIPVGNPETRFEAAASNVDKFENQIQNWLENDAKDVTIPKQDLLSAVDGIKSQFKNDRDYLSISNQVDDFKKFIETRFPSNTVDQLGKDVGEIPISDLNAIKRSTFKTAFNQTGTKVSDVVEYALGDLMKTGIENATKDLPVLGKYPIEEVNRAYGVALNAKKLLKIAMGRPQANFVEHLVSSAFGASVGSAFGPIGTGAGAMAGEAAAKAVPLTAIKSTAGKAARGVSKVIPKIKIPAGAAQTATSVSRIKQLSSPPPAKVKVP